MSRDSDVTCCVSDAVEEGPCPGLYSLSSTQSSDTCRIYSSGSYSSTSTDNCQPCSSGVSTTCSYNECESAGDACTTVSCLQQPADIATDKA